MADAALERRKPRRMIPVTVAVGVAIVATLAFGATIAAHEVGEGGEQLAGDASAVTSGTEVSHAGISRTYAIDSPRLRTAMGWVEGLASGQILASDVSDRLLVQDPDMARTVTAAWSDLTP